MAQHTSPPRATVYSRVSTDRQEEEGTSLDTQAAACRRFAEAQGYAIVAEHRETYSGFELRRPALDRLREAIRARAVDVIICYAVDRLARNQAHLAILLHELEEAGARVEFVTEQFEDSAVGRFILSAKSFAAEIEREKIVERTMRGREAKARAGKPVAGPKPPYGYLWSADRARLEIDPATAPVVRRIFRELVDGRPLNRIGAGLMADGIPAPKGGTIWRRSVLGGLLATPTYMGRAEAFRWSAATTNGKARRRERPPEERIPLPAGTVPALVDTATWEAAQAQLAYNRQHVRRAPATPETHLLRGGHVVCGVCGAPLLAALTSEQRPVYRCRRASGYPRECTFGGTIAAGRLDADVWARAEAALADPALIAREVARLAAQPADLAGAADLVAAERALALLDRQQANLVASLGLVSGHAAALVADQLNTLEARRAGLLAERVHAQARAEERRALLTQLDDLTRLCERVAARLAGIDYANKRLALAALGVVVTLYPADAIPAGLDRRYKVEARIDLAAPLPAAPLSITPRAFGQPHTITVTLPLAAD